MADFPHIAVKLEQQGEVLRLRIGVLYKHLVLIQGLLQHIGAEALRNHGKLQISLVAHVVADRVISVAVRIEIARLAVGVQGKGNGAGHRNGRAKGHRPVRPQLQQRVMHIADVEFDFILLRHRKPPPCRIGRGPRTASRWQSRPPTCCRRCAAYPARPPVSSPPTGPWCRCTALSSRRSP